MASEITRQLQVLQEMIHVMHIDRYAVTDAH